MILLVLFTLNHDYGTLWYILLVYVSKPDRDNMNICFQLWETKVIYDVLNIKSIIYYILEKSDW